MFDITHEGRTTLGTDREAAEALGYPPAVIEAAITEARRKAISAECRRRIYAVASPEAQVNFGSSYAVISNKTIANRTDEQKAVYAAFEAAMDWLEAMRAAYRDMPADADYRADDAWPDMADDVAAIASQF